MNRDFIAHTERYRERVHAQIAGYLAKDYPHSLYEPMRYALQAGGKLLRPLLAIVSCEAVGGRLEDVLDAAAALELVHNFSLVHDDIMDNDDLRRGRETVYKKWNANVGILAGDAILVTAYEALSEITTQYLPQILREFNQGILEVCEGQALDMEFEERQDVTPDEYFYMIDRKTAKLFSLSCVSGAILGGGSEADIRALRTFGMKLGRAFQVQDDLLDLLADQETLGKDIGSDIQADKKTYLVIFTKAHADDRQLQQLDSVRQKKKLGTDDIRQVIDIMQTVGAIDAAQKEVQSALSDARAALNRLENNEPRRLLAGLLDMLEHRTS